MSIYRLLYMLPTFDMIRSFTSRDDAVVTIISLSIAPGLPFWGKIVHHVICNIVTRECMLALRAFDNMIICNGTRHFCMQAASAV
ncbi:hypothetical protein VTO73DRAFT_5808 [Trametes versicolor]